MSEITESSYNEDVTSIPRGTGLITYRRTGGFTGEDTVMTLDEKGFYTITRTMSGRKILEKSGRIEASKVLRVYKMLDEEGFFSLKEKYSPEHSVFDGFEYSIKYTKGDLEKTVTSETEASQPESFTMILKEVEELLKLMME